jgi:hypothetical protein
MTNKGKYLFGVSVEAIIEEGKPLLKRVTHVVD